jgi:3-deoxy-manno-octulosonate cytidylyltransferase (CMP-KDO synthetase)
MANEPKAPNGPPVAAHTVAIIPARMASTRLPGKPLADIAGLPMVVHVARRAQSAGLARVVVAADDERVLLACRAHGVEAILTDAAHPSGSDRLAQACELLGLQDEQIVVNVQGDEPMIAPALIREVALCLQAHPDAAMSTAAHPIHSAAELQSTHVVKVVLRQDGQALYFSRAAIPWWRDAWGAAPIDTHQVAPFPVLRHIGIYAYRVAFLKQFPTLDQAPIEVQESLEQLRALWHGFAIQVRVVADAPGPGVDTAQDLEHVRSLLGHVSSA